MIDIAVEEVRKHDSYEGKSYEWKFTFSAAENLLWHYEAIDRVYLIDFS